MSEYKEYLEDFDVVLLQETHLVPGQEDSIPWPENFEVHVQSRPDPTGMARVGGGVATLVRKGIVCKKRPDLCAEDMLTVQLPGLAILNAYVPPETSPVLPLRAVQPLDRLRDFTVTLLGEGHERVQSNLS